MNAMKVYQILEENGFKKEAAESMVVALQESQDLATKIDLYQMKEELAGNIKDLRTEVYKLMLGQFLAIMAGMTVLLKFIH